MSALAVVCAGIPRQTRAQSRGVYPLGMSATNSGISPAPGFTYSNQLLFYSRDESKDEDGHTLPITGNNSVLMDMNSIIWVSGREFLRGAHFSAFATLPFATNDLTTDIHGNISGGSGFADSYYVPFILGWNKEGASLRVLYGFLAPTGRYVADANNNVGSGYWTHAFSSGQTFYLAEGKSLALSVYEMYEVHTAQEGTQTRPGGTFDLDYSLTQTIAFAKIPLRLQLGAVGYEARQASAHSGPQITPELAEDRYAVNALGFTSNLIVPNQRLNLGFKFFEEFANRSTFQGFSLQISGSVNF